MDFHRSSFKLKLDLWYSFRNSNGKHLNNMSTMHVISLSIAYNNGNLTAN